MSTTHASSSSNIITNEVPSEINKSNQTTPSTLDLEKQQQQQQVISNSPIQSTTATAKTSAFKSLGLLDRFLALWIFLAMLVGILLGNFVEDTGPALQKGKFVGVSIPIAVGLLVMMYPILCKVKFESLHRVFVTREIWKQIVFSVVVNWVIAPLVMLGLSWAFLPDKQGLREGLILVGLARCIAMVLIWTGLAGGDNEYCAILVALNSLLQMILYAPLALLFISIISKDETTNEINKTNEIISYATVAKSVAVFLGIPLAAAILTRIILLRLTTPKFYNQKFLVWISPLSLLGLLFTILVLFASQGRRVIHQIISVLRVSAPLIVYFGIIFFVTLGVCRKFGYGYGVSCTQSFTAASNNFELAIAVAVSAYGVDSDQALAATVGPLIEVPVLLGLVFVCRWVGGRLGWRD